jgi:hypothetical protein
MTKLESAVPIPIRLQIRNCVDTSTDYHSRIKVHLSITENSGIMSWP